VTRIDVELVARGLAPSRSAAQRLIADGAVFMATGERVQRASQQVSEVDGLSISESDETRFVSRAGAKLWHGLRDAQLDVRGTIALDLGMSTGGFTDCLLQQGATRVVGVDVGSAQLHPSLRADPRVLCVEKLNARALDASDLIAADQDATGASGYFDADPDTVAQAPFEPAFDLIVGDLSFISQTLVLPAVVALLKPGGTLLTLVKPQFELQPGQVGKGGIVKDASLYLFVEQRLREACAALGLVVTAWFDSPIAGGDGNREFFICARHPGDDTLSE
jgi:23S rRNA (cytidine1920-2'-O)/16S rRNA (cytidine1409-2'-O)-methyltransferase